MIKIDIPSNQENTLELLLVFLLEQQPVLRGNIALMDQVLNSIVQQVHTLQVREWEKSKIVDHDQQVQHVQPQVRSLT
jgi:hypothetical protein